MPPVTKARLEPTSEDSLMEQRRNSLAPRSHPSSPFEDLDPRNASESSWYCHRTPFSRVSQVRETSSYTLTSVLLLNLRTVSPSSASLKPVLAFSRSADLELPCARGAVGIAGEARRQGGSWGVSARRARHGARASRERARCAPCSALRATEDIRVSILPGSAVPRPSISSTCSNLERRTRTRSAPGGYLEWLPVEARRRRAMVGTGSVVARRSVPRKLRQPAARQPNDDEVPRGQLPSPP
jgi:hypothetical protein